MIVASTFGMLTSVRSIAFIFCTVLFAVGCGPEGDPLENTDDVRTWANRSSAVGLWSRVHDIVGAGRGRDPFRDPECPVITEEADTVTITGGCTGNDGETWIGSATIVRDGADGEDISIDGFGHSEDPELVATVSGTVQIRALAEGHSFALSLTNDAPFEGLMTISYDGAVVGDYTTPTVWNGQGTITLGGQTVSATTVDQTWDDTMCRGAPASGQTTLVSEMHAVVIRYDGAIDCDEDKEASWSRDGTEMGAIDGISCAISPGSSRNPAWIMCGLGVVLVWRRRRRTARSGAL